MRRKVKCAVLMTVILTGSILLSACKSTEAGAEAQQESAEQESTKQTTETVIEAAEPISFEGSVAEASDIYVAPVAGMSDDFVRGVEIGRASCRERV